MNDDQNADFHAGANSEMPSLSDGADPSEESKAELIARYDAACKKAWVLKWCGAQSAADLGHWSRLYGFGGLCFLGVMIGVGTPLGIQLVESIELFRLGTPAVVISIVYGVMLPGVATGTIIAGASSLISSLLLFSLVATIGLILPGFLTFALLMTMFEGGPGDGFYAAMAIVFVLLGLASVFSAVAFEMFSRTRVIRLDEECVVNAPKMGIQRLFELTGITAVGIALLRTGTDVPFVAQLIILIFATLLACIGAGLLLVFLKDPNVTKKSILIGFLIACLAIAVAIAIPSFMQPGFPKLSGSQFIWLIFAIPILAAMLTANVGLCIAWLRGCGWRTMRI